MKHLYTFCLCLLVTLGMGIGLSACGVKPKKVEAPVGADQSTFPRTYPDPRTDPRPE